MKRLTIILTIILYSVSMIIAQDLESIYQNAIEGNYDYAINEYSVHYLNTSNIDALVGRAQVYAWKGDFQHSLDDYSEAIEKDPENLQARIGLGYLYAWNEMPYSAIETFETLLKIDPKNKEVLKGIAYVHLWAGNFSEARNYFATLRQIDQSDLDSWVGLGETYLQSGDVHQGRVIMSHVLSFDPNHENALNQLHNAIYQPAMFDFSIWSGVSEAGSENGSAG